MSGIRLGCYKLLQVLRQVPNLFIFIATIVLPIEHVVVEPKVAQLLGKSTVEAPNFDNN